MQVWVATRLDGGRRLAFGEDRPLGLAAGEGWRCAKSRSRCFCDSPCWNGRTKREELKGCELSRER
jgi:hypothetical protein